MKPAARLPLLAKMLLWLLLHLLVLALLFAGFVAWQLRLGLDSLLSGATGERLRTLGELLARDLQASREDEWRAILQAEAQRRGIDLDLWLPRAGFRHDLIPPPPDNIRRRLDQVLPAQQPAPGNAPRFVPPPRPGPGPERPEADDPPQPAPPFPGGPEPLPRLDGERAAAPPPAAGGGEPPGKTRPAPGHPGVRPAFLARGDGDGHFWAAVDLPLAGRAPDRPGHVVLVVRSGEWSGRGLFFDFQPWFFGGLAVLALSVAFWTPFFISIRRYLRHLATATEHIAEGRFDVVIDTARRDELGELGGAIGRMAARLDHLLAGQKRFLGDVAHELCSPLARLRTGLGILEQRLAAADRPRLEAIEAEAAELAALVEEILAFSRAAAGRRPQPKPLALAPLVARAAARECHDTPPEIVVAPSLTALADERLLERAVANVLRNSRRYAGARATIRVSAETRRDRRIALCIDDDGPGVPEGELGRLFEPFYRPDDARSRDHGGAGLGLAIVRSCAEACGGTASARNLRPHGFRVELLLPAAAPPP